jgi:glutamine kinase
MEQGKVPFSFSTKSANLLQLQGKLRSAKILPQFSFSIEEWKKNSTAVLNNLKKIEWSNQHLIVRSSSANEDSEFSSGAGAFDSVGNVFGFENVKNAIETVSKSFEKNLSQSDCVFVQPFLSNVKMSGVCFTVELNSGNPYFVINYDDSSGKTDSVTSGATNKLKTFYCFKHAKVVPEDKNLNAILKLANELERITGSSKLDIEFAIDSADQLFLLQVRPVAKIYEQVSDVEDSNGILDRAHSFFQKVSQRNPLLHGDRTILGVMPDWNPAEIIGVKPRALSFSLYKELVTDAIWAYQRDNYGYKNLRSFPLIHDLGSHPYVDVRVCFNSFLPKDLDSQISEKLVNYYLNYLAENPSLHDKVEFEIVLSCYSFDIDQKLAVLKQNDFSDFECEQIRKSLKNLTNRIIHSKNGLWKQDLEKVQKLAERRELVANSDLDTVSKIYWLVEDCKRYGTLPFAGLARAGFMAVQILKSFIKVGIISRAEFDSFMLQLNTVGSMAGKDVLEMSKDEFIEKYGHLRPGTYEITSPRYDEAPDLYFDWKKIDQDKKSAKAHSVPGNFSLTLDQFRKIGALIKENDLDMEALELFDFIKSAIEGRESSKFEFTKNVSLILQEIEKLGKEFGISKEDLSYLDYRTISHLYSSSDSPKSVLLSSIELGKKKYERAKGLCMPPLIVRAEDVFHFHLMDCQPNFITGKKVTGESVLLKDLGVKIEGKIVFIPSADPGYDWIFSKNIVGFVTMFGGANSHMAIRAAELNMPAVIGAGESLFHEWLNSNRIELDCLNQKVSLL